MLTIVFFLSQYSGVPAGPRARSAKPPYRSWAGRYFQKGVSAEVLKVSVKNPGALLFPAEFSSLEKLEKISSAFYSSVFTSTMW